MNDELELLEADDLLVMFDWRKSLLWKRKSLLLLWKG